jgi:hypothetical protein
MFKFKTVFLIALLFRLTEILGYQSVVKNLDELRYPKYLKRWEEIKAKGGKEEAEGGEDLKEEEDKSGRKKMVDLLDARFPDLQAEVKEKVVNLVMSAAQASDQEISELADEVLDPLATGLSTHYVSVAGTIYRLPTNVWQEVATTIGPTGIFSQLIFNLLFCLAMTTFSSVVTPTILDVGAAHIRAKKGTF